MKLEQIKLEFFHIRKAFIKYRHGWRYIYNRFIMASSIRRYSGILEKPITNNELSIHIMLGHQHINMALWCLASFYSASEVIGQLYVHSDGSLLKSDLQTLRKFLPSAVFINPKTVLSEYAAEFNKFPIIRDFRAKYAANFFLTKLVDPYIVSDKKYRLFFDIDILWFKNPDNIAREIAYGCAHSLMMAAKFAGPEADKYNTVYFRDGSKIASQYSQYNGGIMLYARDNLDANKLADYFERLDMTRPESQHWVEQAGYAYNLKNLIKLESDKYIIKGPVTPETICKHYTGPRRVEFYTEGLPLIKKNISANN